MKLRHHPTPPGAGHRLDSSGATGPRERGVAVVEFALIFTVLATIVFGALDFGFQWRYAHEATSASRVGARFGARLGDDRYADLQILAAVRTALQSSGTRADLSRIIIYRANSNGRPPASCVRETSPSGQCNVYPRSVVNFTLTESQFGTNGCMLSGATYSGWCPTTRRTEQADGDTLGVMVVVDTPSITGLFPTREARRHTAMQIEPQY